MQWAQLIKELELESDAEVLQHHWEQSLETFPKPMPDFLKHGLFRHSAQFCGFEDETIAALDTVRQEMAGDEALMLLAWHCHRLLFWHTDYEGMQQWPLLTKRLGELHGAFYLIVAASMVPLVEAAHRSLGVSADVTRATCQQVSCFAENYRRMTKGGLGIPRRQLFWLRHYPAGRLFRIGRMEYMLRPFKGKIKVYRQRDTGQTVALCCDGVAFNRYGLIDGSEDWLSSLQLQNGTIIGNPVLPWGYAQQRPVELNLSQWDCVLRPGDITLDMHIPAGGSMQLEKCRQSMTEAVPFFRETFPNTMFNSISCSSWIFNTQLEDIRLSSDNLVQFQRELYLYPVPSNGTDGLWFIFFQEPFDLASAPRDTSLQRAVADYLEQGHTWRGGGMFFLAEDLPFFGTQCYRNQRFFQ